MTRTDNTPTHAVNIPTIEAINSLSQQFAAVSLLHSLAFNRLDELQLLARRVEDLQARLAGGDIKTAIKVAAEISKAVASNTEFAGRAYRPVDRVWHDVMAAANEVGVDFGESSPWTTPRELVRLVGLGAALAEPPKIKLMIEIEAAEDISPEASDAVGGDADDEGAVSDTAPDPKPLQARARDRLAEQSAHTVRCYMPKGGIQDVDARTRQLADVRQQIAYTLKALAARQDVGALETEWSRLEAEATRIGCAPVADELDLAALLAMVERLGGAS